MIAHADISVNAAYADMVNADGANSLNLKTCFCAKCAEVACIHPKSALRKKRTSARANSISVLRTGCRDPKRVDCRIALLQVCKSLRIRNNTHISMRLTVMFLTQKFEPVTYNRSACVLKARSLVVAMVAVQPGEFHRGKQT